MSDQEVPGPVQGRPGQGRLFLKTRLCKFWAVGACSRSTECKFAHGQQDMRQLPDFTKTRLCPAYLAGGACGAGESCCYAHGPEELRPCVSEAAQERALGEHTAGDGDNYEGQLAALLAMRAQLREAACSLARFQDALLRASAGPCDDGSFAIPSSGTSRQTTAGAARPAADGEGAGGPASDSEGWSEASDDLPWRLEVKNTFVTVTNEVANEGGTLRNSRSSPSLLQRH